MRPEGNTPKAYWLVETRSGHSDQWYEGAICVDGSRNWTASDIVDEYHSRYFGEGSDSIRVAPINTPKSWDVFDKSVDYHRREGL